MAVVKVAQGKYIGFGYISTDSFSADYETLNDCIRKRKDNWDARIIIRSYLKKYHRQVKIVEF